MRTTTQATISRRRGLERTDMIVAQPCRRRTAKRSSRFRHEDGGLPATGDIKEKRRRIVTKAKRMNGGGTGERRKCGESVRVRMARLQMKVERRQSGQSLLFPNPVRNGAHLIPARSSQPMDASRVLFGLWVSEVRKKL
jgi:hypothetical protein